MANFDTDTNTTFAQLEANNPTDQVTNMVKQSKDAYFERWIILLTIGMTNVALIFPLYILFDLDSETLLYYFIPACVIVTVTCLLTLAILWTEYNTCLWTFLHVWAFVHVLSVTTMLAGKYVCNGLSYYLFPDAFFSVVLLIIFIDMTRVLCRYKRNFISGLVELE